MSKPPPLAEWQAACLETLYAEDFDPDALFLTSLSSDAKRFTIYRNNLWLGLSNTLEAIYPVTLQMLGDTAFKAFAHSYIVQNRMTSGNRDTYGAGLDALLSVHPETQALAFLADVARLEWGVHSAHHAPSPQTLGFEDLVTQVSIGLNPAVQLIPQSCNGWDIYQAHLAEKLDDLKIVTAAHTRLVYRTLDMEILALRLSEAETAFLQNIDCNQSLALAVSHIEPGHEAALQSLLAQGVQHGWFVAA